MKIIIAKPGVTDGSSVLDVGTAIEFPEKVAENLINGGYATAAEEAEAPEGDGKAAEEAEAPKDSAKTRKTTAKKTK